MSTPLPPDLPPGAWLADPARSAGELQIRRPALPALRGRFAVLAAGLVALDGAPVLTGVVAVASIVVEHTDAARPREVLDAARFPRLGFASTSIRRRGSAIEVHGDLTVRGIARPLRAVGAASVAGPGTSRLALDLTAEVDLREYGAGTADDAPACAYDVVLSVHLELTRA